MEYEILGSNFQAVRVVLREEEEVYAEAGNMVCKTSNVEMETRLTGKGWGGKLMGLLKRKIAGESAFVTYFRCAEGKGEVCFTGGLPGKIEAVEITLEKPFIAQKDAFLCATSGVEFTITFQKKLGAGFFGGEGFILEKFQGEGVVFVNAAGDLIKYELDPGEKIQVETGCVVGFDSTVTYSVELVGGIKTAIFGGEGLFLATLTGPGRAFIQTTNIEKLKATLDIPETTSQGD